MNAEPQSPALSGADRGIVWVAQGFGVGRLPVAPGTFGTLLGFPLFFALLATGCLSGFLGLWLITAGAAVWLCGRAERILGSTDPGCIVLDEIVAVPLCFLAWVLWLTAERGRFPAAMEFLAGRAWIGTLLSFAGFRLLDIAKPWPIRKLQELPGGWGVVADDLAAGAGVSAGSWLVLWLLGNS